MKSLRMLDEADDLCLASLLDPESLPRLNGEHRAALVAVLKESSISRDIEELECRIGIGDRITLVSPEDSRDWYKPEIVLPHDADLDEDRISVLTPVGLAVVGRRIGDRVSWDTPAGERLMTITAVQKHALSA